MRKLTDKVRFPSVRQLSIWQGLIQNQASLLNPCSLPFSDLLLHYFPPYECKYLQNGWLNIITPSYLGVIRVFSFTRMGFSQGPETGNYTEWSGVNLEHGAKSMCLSWLTTRRHKHKYSGCLGQGVGWGSHSGKNSQEMEGRWFMEDRLRSGRDCVKTEV